MNCYRYGGSCEELCDLYPCIYAKGYEQGMADARADEREKVLEEVKKYINTHRYGNDDIIEFLEKLKENKE